MPDPRVGKHTFERLFYWCTRTFKLSYPSPPPKGVGTLEELILHPSHRVGTFSPERCLQTKQNQCTKFV